MKDTTADISVTSLKKIYSGKVRDLYEIDDKHILIVASDRLSAFDVILPTAIPGKGEILTRISNFWFDKFAGIIANQLADLKLKNIITDKNELKRIKKRSVVAKKLKALPIEAIVRGYIIGSGWKDYQQTGMVCGIKLPAGLQQAEKLPEPLFTPSTKAAVGDHDMNISFANAANLIGQEMIEKVRDISLRMYTLAAEHALNRGIIIADTKFEFGLDDDGNLFLIDEVLTPDSSRFWPATDYQAGISPPSFDKQFVRDYLETLGWNKKSPGPVLPQEIIDKTVQNYQQALDLLVGE